jgi:flagellar basal body-associated protein FliL
MIRELLARAAARKRQLNLILLAVLTVLFLVTLVVYGFRMSQ